MDYKADLTIALHDFKDGELCGEPFWLPPGFITDEVSARYRMNWAAEGSEEMVPSYQSFLSFTSKEMTDFEKDLTKNAFEWMRRQRGQAQNRVTWTGTRVSGQDPGNQSEKRRRDKEQRLSIRTREAETREEGGI